MNPGGADFSPDLIQLMKAVVEDASAALPEAKRTSAIKAEMACHDRDHRDILTSQACEF